MGVGGYSPKPPPAPQGILSVAAHGLSLGVSKPYMKLGSFRAQFAAALAIPMALLIIANIIALGALLQVGGAQDRLSKAETIRVTAGDTKYQRYLTRFDIRQYVLKNKIKDSQAESTDTAALTSDEDQ